MDDEITRLYPSAYFISVGGNKDKHIVHLRLKCKSKDEFKEWLQQHENLSGITYRVNQTRPSTGKKVIYKAYYRCQRNTVPTSHKKVKAASSKHTGCKASLKVTILAFPEGRKDHSKDALRTIYPTIIEVHHNHNHHIDSADARRYKDVSEDCKKKFLELFKSHHKPAKCLEIHKQNLMKEYKENYFLAAADRSICPDSQWVYRFYYANFKKDKCSEKDKILKRNKVVKNFSTCGKEENNLQSLANLISTSDVNAKMEVIGNDFVVAVCTPLMERVHSLELTNHVFIDNSGYMEHCNCQVYLLMTDSSIGGLPLGLLISSSKSESVITSGLNLLKEVFPLKAFNGKQSPERFFTDNCTSLQSSLQNTFPDSSVWLSSFHILQGVWWWLCDEAQQIEHMDRKELYHLFKTIVFAENYDSFNNAVSCLKGSNTSQKYNHYISYVESLVNTCEKWGQNFRQSTRGNDLNHLAESALNVLKDRTLDQIKKYTIKQVFHYLTVSLPEFFKKKILDLISGANYKNGKYIPNRRKLENIIMVNEISNVYTVNDNQTNCQYEVNVDLGLCSCSFGLSNPCKHQYFVTIKQPNSINVVLTEDAREYYHWIATGSRGITQEKCTDTSQEEAVSSVLESHSDETITAETILLNLEVICDDNASTENIEQNLSNSQCDTPYTKTEVNFISTCNQLPNDVIDNTNRSMEQNLLDSQHIAAVTEIQENLISTCNQLTINLEDISDENVNIPNMEQNLVNSHCVATEGNLIEACNKITTNSKDSSDKSLRVEQGLDQTLPESHCISAVTETKNLIEIPDDNQNLLKNFLLSFGERLKDGFQRNPREFRSATERMQNQLEEMETESAFLSAMHSFGKSQQQPYKRATIITLRPSVDGHSMQQERPAVGKIKEHPYCKQNGALGNRVHPYNSSSKSDILNWLQQLL